MRAPATYAEWARLLERFGNGDDAVIEELSEGYFEADAGTAQRFCLRVEEAYKKRKQRWLDHFQRTFKLQPIKTNGDFEIVLRNGKQNLHPLVRLVSLKVLPPLLQDTLSKDLEAFVAEIKTSLKNNISGTAHNREKMLLSLNAFSTVGFNAEKTVTEKPGNGNEAAPPAGRKIMF